MTRSFPDFKEDITVYHGPQFPHFNLINSIQGLQALQITSPAELLTQRAILLLDDQLLELFDFDAWACARPDEVPLICEDEKGDGDFIVPTGWPIRFTGKALQAALTQMMLRFSQRTMQAQLIEESAKITQLTSIARDLSAETNLDSLLTKILTEGRSLACCDAAALFLIDKDDQGKDELVFKLTQNDSISFPFEEKRFPLNSHSISGFVAITGEICNIDDVYEIDESAPYVFNRFFDQTMNYRTRSTITIPMCDHQHDKEVIGVLQFLNRKTSAEVVLSSTDITLKETLPFSEDLAELLMALASQAAIAIENANLIAQVQGLFEGFVKASVTAIEQRDPSTCGHSFRVANLTTKLALMAPLSGLNRFKDLSYDDNAIREIRYASLLHDFGKVGVREHVLVKANKLPEKGLENIKLRFAVLKEQIRLKVCQQRLDCALELGRDGYQKLAPEFDQKMEAEIARFEAFYQAINKANKPTILSQGCFDHLNEIRDLPALSLGDEQITLLDDEEFLALSVKRGSLTSSERLEIESHVRHTFEFLSRIPWTADLRNTPQIAYAHHEKLDGSGYPRGLTKGEIPLASLMMAVTDIYDALTASDRPYKRSMTPERALSILEDEANRGLLDTNLVNIFMEAKIYEHAEVSEDQSYRYHAYPDRFIKRNICDYDLLPLT